MLYIDFTKAVPVCTKLENKNAANKGGIEILSKIH
jgi:hypothetical protein